MQKWEYEVVATDIERKLFNPSVISVNGENVKEKQHIADYFSSLGKAGWELVCAEKGNFIFKRPIRG